MSQLNPILNTAFRAARKAGDLMLRHSKELDHIKINNVNINHKTLNEFIADLTQNAEDLIVNILQEAYPNHHIISQGKSVAGQQHSDLEWFITPLDGSENYIHRSAHYAISMALLEKGVLKEALIYAPERNDLYTASRGKGAELNGRRIRVSNRFELSHCLIQTGCTTHAVKDFDYYLTLLKEFLQKSAGIRSTGTTSLDLCALAIGQCDGFFQSGLTSWEMAAGALLIQEAGGIVTDFDGEQHWLDSGNIVAANPKMLAQMLKMIGQYR